MAFRHSQQVPGMGSHARDLSVIAKRGHGKSMDPKEVKSSKKGNMLLEMEDRRPLPCAVSVSLS